MQLTATSKPLLYSASMPITGDLQLDHLPWQSVAQPPPGFEYRNILQNFDACNPILTTVINHIRNCQYTLLDTLWTNDYFKQHLWGCATLDQLKSIVSPYIELTRDQPGYYCVRHVDNLRAITTGMIFFNDQHSPRSSTRFYTKQYSLRSLTMPSGMGQGWYTANWHDCWHSGANRTSTVRYSVKFGLNLTLPD